MEALAVNIRANPVLAEEVELVMGVDISTAMRLEHAVEFFLANDVVTEVDIDIVTAEIEAIFQAGD